MKRILAIIILMTIAFSGCSSKKEQTSKPLYVEFLNTGKSDCTIIMADGLAALCDTADEDDSVLILNKLNALGIKELECMIITHFDKDHIGSAADIFRAVNVKRVYMPIYEKYSSRYDEMMAVIENSKAELIRLDSDISFNMGGAEISINTPKENSYENENNYSLITAIRYGNSGVLLAGDALKDRLNEFNEVNTESFQVVKLPHHGDYNKGVKALIEQTEPKYCIITCDKTRETVEDKLYKLIADERVTACYTDMGSYAFVADGKSISPVD